MALTSSEIQDLDLINKLKRTQNLNDPILARRIIDNCMKHNLIKSKLGFNFLLDLKKVADRNPNQNIAYNKPSAISQYDDVNIRFGFIIEEYMKNGYKKGRHSYNSIKMYKIKNWALFVIHILICIPLTFLPIYLITFSNLIAFSPSYILLESILLGLIFISGYFLVRKPSRVIISITPNGDIAEVGNTLKRKYNFT